MTLALYAVEVVNAPLSLSANVRVREVCLSIRIVDTNGLEVGPEFATKVNRIEIA